MVMGHRHAGCHENADGGREMRRTSETTAKNRTPFPDHAGTSIKKSP
jgi:hypothetical protein